MQELYVYYKVEPERIDAARAAFAQLCAALSEQLPGLQSRLLGRPAEPGEVQTWMEVHVRAANGRQLPNDWPARVEALAHARHTGPRHVELFTAL